MSEDFAWFKERYTDFQKKYGESFIAIKNKKILGVYDSYGNGVRETVKTEELGTFIVQECSPGYNVYQWNIF
jgi:hypothetical protein